MLRSTPSLTGQGGVKPLGEHGVELPEQIRAVIFDTDGVVTRTADVHAQAWARLFDAYLADRAATTGEAFVPFSAADYLHYVDGKPRYDGVESFLASRSIVLPRGEPTDAPETLTLCGLGNRKNGYFHQHLRDHGVEPFESTLRFAAALRGAGIATGVISASENCAEILESAGATTFFDVRVDGLDANRLGLPGKPDPAIFIEAARRLEVEPAEAAIVEDAISGVEAGRAGGFGLVIGVDRVGQADALAHHGADLVVNDLSELSVSPTTRRSG